MNKMWKGDGEEQKQLEKLFREREVNYTMKPGDVQKKYPLFHGFTAHVFRKHWNLTKMMFVSPGTTGVKNVSADMDIIEIDGTEPSPAKVAKVSLTDKPSMGNVTHIQPPIVTTRYTDPDTNQDICLVIISLVSKIKRVDFDVVAVENSHVLKVSYSWPSYMYNGTEMFKREGEAVTFVNKLHPKFLAVEKALKDVRENIEDAPQGVLEIVLPDNIQLDPATWTNYFNKKPDGTLIVFFEFLCARTDYIIRKKEKTILLD